MRGQGPGGDRGVGGQAAKLQRWRAMQDGTGFASDRADGTFPCQRQPAGHPSFVFDKPEGMWHAPKKSPHTTNKVGSKWRPIKTAGPSAPARTAIAAPAFTISIAARS